jgi:hypothetical protein
VRGRHAREVVAHRAEALLDDAVEPREVGLDHARAHARLGGDAVHRDRGLLVRRLQLAHVRLQLRLELAAAADVAEHRLAREVLERHLRAAEDQVVVDLAVRAGHVDPRCDLEQRVDEGLVARRGGVREGADRALLDGVGVDGDGDAVAQQPLDEFDGRLAAARPSQALDDRVGGLDLAELARLAGGEVERGAVGEGQDARRLGDGAEPLVRDQHGDRGRVEPVAAPIEGEVADDQVGLRRDLADEAVDLDAHVQLLGDAEVRRRGVHGRQAQHVVRSGPRAEARVHVGAHVDVEEARVVVADLDRADGAHVIVEHGRGARGGGLYHLAADGGRHGRVVAQLLLRELRARGAPLVEEVGLRADVDARLDEGGRRRRALLIPQHGLRGHRVVKPDPAVKSDALCWLRELR